MSVLLRSPGTSAINAGVGATIRQGPSALRCGSSAARSISTSWSVSGGRKPRESWMLQAQAKYDEFEALPLIVLARLK